MTTTILCGSMMAKASGEVTYLGHSNRVTRQLGGKPCPGTPIRYQVANVDEDEADSYYECKDHLQVVMHYGQPHSPLAVPLRIFWDEPVN